MDICKLILSGSSIANGFSKSVKVCYNAKSNVLFYPQGNYVHQRKNNLDFQVEIDSDGIQCESDFNQEQRDLPSNSLDYIVSNAKQQISKIFLFSQIIISGISKPGLAIFSLGIIENLCYPNGLTFLAKNYTAYTIYKLNSIQHNFVTLLSSPNQINDYGFQQDNTLIACGVNSLIYFDSQIINPSASGIDTTDYDYKNIQPGLDLNQLNYSNLIMGDYYTVFYGISQIITVVINRNRAVQLNKYLNTQILIGLKPNAVIEGSLLKTLSLSGLLLFLEVLSTQIFMKKKQQASILMMNQVEFMHFKIKEIQVILATLKVNI
ncbi:hypothetical protein ABPG72_000581 [Tetrahymena utriculariae]